MIRKLLNEYAKLHSLPTNAVNDIMVDFLEMLLKEEKILMVDLEDYLANVFKDEKPVEKPVEKLADVTVRLDADTKEIVRFLFDNNVVPARPISITFDVRAGIEHATVDLDEGRAIPRVAVVRRTNGKLIFQIKFKPL